MAKRTQIKPALKEADFSYLKDEELPALMLGIEYKLEDFWSDWPPVLYDLKPGRQWHKVVVQTAGHACHHHYLIGTLLRPTERARLGMRRLTEKWLESDAGAFGVPLGELLQYRDDLKTFLDADCNDSISYRGFEEAYYPIDTEYAQQLTVEELPKSLDDFINWKDGFQRACGCIGRWKLVVLGKNCD